MKRFTGGLLLAAAFLLLTGCQKGDTPAPSTPPTGGGTSSAGSTESANIAAGTPDVIDANMVFVSLSVPNMH